MGEASTSDDKKKEDFVVPKGYRRKKDLPPVDFLLKHGDPEKVKSSTSAWDTNFIIFVVVTFILSFFVFQYIIDNHTTYDPSKFLLPQDKPGYQRITLKPKTHQEEPAVVAEAAADNSEL